MQESNSSDMSFDAISVDDYLNDAYEMYLDSSADVQRTEDDSTDEDDGEEVIQMKDQFSEFFEITPLPDDDDWNTWGCRESYEQAYLVLKRAFKNVDYYLDDIFVKVKWDEKGSFQQYYSYRGLQYVDLPAETLEDAMQAQILWYHEEIVKNPGLGHTVKETGFMTLHAAKHIMSDDKAWSEAWYGEASTQKTVGKPNPRFTYPQRYREIAGYQMLKIKHDARKFEESKKLKLKGDLRDSTVKQLSALESFLSSDFVAYKKGTSRDIKRVVLDRLETFIDNLNISDLEKVQRLFSMV